MDVMRMYWAGTTGLMKQLMHDQVFHNGEIPHLSSSAQSSLVGTDRVPVALVTGADRGIGAALVTRLSVQGYAVIAACMSLDTVPSSIDDHPRSSEWPVTKPHNVNASQNHFCQSSQTYFKLKSKYPSSLKAGDIVPLQLDLLDTASIRLFAQRIFEVTDDSLDLVVHNAGIMLCPFRLSSIGIEEHMQVNVFGPFLLNCLLLQECLQQEIRPTFLIVTSITHACEALDLTYLHGSSNPFIYRPHRSYMQTKLAALMLNEAFRRRYGERGFHFIASDPGIVNTKLYQYTPVLFQWLQKKLGSFIMRSPVVAAQYVLMPLQHNQILIECPIKSGSSPNADAMPQINKNVPCQSHFAFGKPCPFAAHVNSSDLQDKLFSWMQLLAKPYLIFK
eukprot:gene8974-1308_t